MVLRPSTSFMRLLFIFFLLLISALQLCLSPEKERKACFAPCAPANSAWTSSIISRGCCFSSFFVQSLHASHATRSSSSGPWWFTGELTFSFSAHPGGFPWFGWFPPRKGKQGLAYYSAAALMCAAQLSLHNGRKGMRGKECTAQPVPYCWQHRTAAVGPIPLIISLLYSFFPPVGSFGKEHIKISGSWCLLIFLQNRFWFSLVGNQYFSSWVAHPSWNTPKLKSWSDPSYSVYLKIFLLALWPSF